MPCFPNRRLISLLPRVAAMKEMDLGVQVPAPSPSSGAGRWLFHSTKALRVRLGTGIWFFHIPEQRPALQAIKPSQPFTLPKGLPDKIFINTEKCNILYGLINTASFVEKKKKLFIQNISANFNCHFVSWHSFPLFSSAFLVTVQWNIHLWKTCSTLLPYWYFNKVLKQHRFCTPLSWMSLGVLPATNTSCIN